MLNFQCTGQRNVCEEHRNPGVVSSLAASKLILLEIGMSWKGSSDRTTRKLPLFRVIIELVSA